MFFILFLLSVLPNQSKAEGLTIAAAANVQFTLEELKTEFIKATGINVRVVIGASGKLTSQIENGAPFDIFMSADMEYPNQLLKDGLTLSEPRIYAYGHLVLLTLKEVDLSKGVEGLTGSSFHRIALASPKSAPYGRAAVNVMKHYHLYPSITDKLVYGESIAQVNQFITTKAVDAGFTSKSAVLAPSLKTKGKWIDVDQSSYDPIAQGIVILKYARSREDDARKFIDFLSSQKASMIFRKYGYTLP